MSSNGLVQIEGLAPITKEDRKKSKVMLLFPPEWVPTAPYLALPSLTAVLREAGHTVIQRDINIGMWDPLLQYGVPDLGKGPDRHATQIVTGQRKERLSWISDGA